ncbi:hypothetical protein PBAL39_22655 [Pedobacter sp. BAL39]|nr:hypothetical protein PBAL39_22655 [Pedobacter sp. BAL39]
MSNKHQFTKFIFIKIASSSFHKTGKMTSQNSIGL